MPKHTDRPTMPTIPDPPRRAQVAAHEHARARDRHAARIARRAHESRR